MNGYLLDTNVISEYSRPWPPDAGVRAWVDAQNENLLHLSVLTLGEIRKGTTVLAAGRKRHELERWLETDLPARFRESSVAGQWGHCGDLGRHGGTSTTQRNHGRHNRGPHGGHSQVP